NLGLIGQVMASGKSRWMLDLRSEDAYLRREAAADAELISGFAFPVMIRTEVVAVLEFYSEQSVAPDPALLEVMGHVGIQLGRVLERDRTRLLLEEHAQRLSALSLRDELTGLYNRRGFMELARQQLRFVERNKRPVVLIFVDLDGMKPINDTLGHEQGDHAIQETAQILKRTFRASDIVARLGGDEFVVLAIDANAERADAARQRTRAAVDAWNARGAAPFQLSLSLGTAQHEPGETIEDLLTRADAEMYQQKRARPGSRLSR
ncbi:MAG TPA: sensor domain-containing diguanylate cyclase, partial [Polyangiales bacterium]|nr:sensor domain-containing diguanylate cyclase [Polyangiales bacterium]